MYKSIVQAFFAKANVSVGYSSSNDIEVVDDTFWSACVRQGSLGFFESYAHGLCEIRSIREVCKRIIESGQDRSWLMFMTNLPLWIRARTRNLQSDKKRFDIAAHYNISDEYYKHVLGRSRAYTSAVYLEEEMNDFSEKTLTGAQQRKFKSLLDPLELQSGGTLFDLGCGYGGLLRYAYRHYGVSIHGLSNSTGHIDTAKRLCEANGIPAQLYPLDYKAMKYMSPKFDAVTEVEVRDSIGPRQQKESFQLIHHLLKPKGRLSMQTIISDREEYEGNRFLDTYIFPGAVIHTQKRILSASRDLFDVIAPIVDITPSYVHTLEVWNYLRKCAIRGHLFADLGIDEFFNRIWNAYLEMCPASFETGRNRVVQIVFQKK
jgi:cyclopropane-fatty-acyl-phospholipid synthase